MSEFCEHALTDRQTIILKYIESFQKEKGMSPTISEIAAHFKISGPTTFAHVRALQRKGVLSRTSKARSLTVTPDGYDGGAFRPTKARTHALQLSVPLLGRISAGAPLFSEENIERRLDIDISLLPRRSAQSRVFALQVNGESMRDLGILDGDILICMNEHKANVGDIVVASLEDGDTTVKSFYVKDGQIELRPANRDFKSRFFDPSEVSIQGVVVALNRTYIN